MADDVESNFLEFEAEFRDLIGKFDFLLVGEEQSLGRDLASAAAWEISGRSHADQTNAQGSPWAPNAPKYAAMKVRKWDVHVVGARTGQMLGHESVLGEVQVEPDEVTMTYGTGTSPARFATHGDLRPDEPTDRQKAEWFADSGREFYELSEADAEKIYAMTGKALADYLENA